MDPEVGRILRALRRARIAVELHRKHDYYILVVPGGHTQRVRHGRLRSQDVRDLRCFAQRAMHTS